jgi:hypothetical protein
MEDKVQRKVLGRGKTGQVTQGEHEGLSESNLKFTQVYSSSKSIT